MPMTYGNVAGFKFANVQTEYDPDAPKKPTRYPGKSLAQGIMRGEAYHRGGKATHGTLYAFEHGCRCERCWAAYNENLAKKREQSAERRLNKRARAGNVAKCRICRNFKPLDQFPYIDRRCRWTHVCADCYAAKHGD